MCTVGSSTRSNGAARAASSARIRRTMVTSPTRWISSMADLSSSATARASGQGRPVRPPRRRRAWPAPRKSARQRAVRSWSTSSATSCPASSVRFRVVCRATSSSTPRTVRIESWSPNSSKMKRAPVQFGLRLVERAQVGQHVALVGQHPGAAERVGVAVTCLEHRLVEFDRLHQVVGLMLRRGVDQ